MSERGKRLWILNHYANTPNCPGPTRHYDLAKRLVARGFSVTIVASSLRRIPGHISTEGRPPLVAGDVDGVQCVWLRSVTRPRANNATRVWNMLEFALRLLRNGRTCFRGTAPRPEVVIASSPHPFTALVGWWLAGRFRVPFVLEVRDLWPETFVGFGDYGPRHPVVFGLRLLERFLYRRADRIIALMPEAWRYIETQAGVSREKVVWISNGAHVGEETPRRPGDEASRPFTVMYMGTHGRANVLEDLLLAARFLQEQRSGIQFELVGSGKEKNRLIKRSRDLGLANLRFLDPVPRTQVEATLARADALAVLLEDTELYRYGISLNKLFDYMASGKPVVLAGDPAHNYVDLARCGVTVPPRDPRSLADAIAALAQTPAEVRSEMGERGREYVRCHHDWDLLADRLARTLEDLMSREEA